MFNYYLTIDNFQIFFDSFPNGTIQAKVFDLKGGDDYIFKNKYIGYSLDEVSEIIKAKIKGGQIWLIQLQELHL